MLDGLEREWESLLSTDDISRLHSWHICRGGTTSTVLHNIDTSVYQPLQINTT